MGKATGVTRRRFVWSAAAGMLIAATGPMRIARAQAKFKLRYYSWVPKTSVFAEGMAEFVKAIEAKTNGEVTLEWGGSAEATGPFQAADAITNGIYDAGHLANSLYASSMPEATCLSAGTAPAAKLRATGALDAYADVMKKRNGLVFLGMPASGPGYTFLTRTPINSLADMKGRKIRSLPLYDPLIRALGGSPTTIAPAEVFTALENGVVDGLGWSDFGIIEFRFNEKTNFRLTPTFYGARTAFVVGPQAWARLPAPIQKALTDATKDAELAVEKHYLGRHAEEQKKLSELGMKTTALSAAEGKTLKDTANQVMWDKIVKDSAQNGPRLKEAFDKAEA
jgi:TRAP-type C4-dicarboxylate transport system substrate-binding protein